MVSSDREEMTRLMRAHVDFYDAMRELSARTGYSIISLTRVVAVYVRDLPPSTFEQLASRALLPAGVRKKRKNNGISIRLPPIPDF